MAFLLVNDPSCRRSDQVVEVHGADATHSMAVGHARDVNSFALAVRLPDVVALPSFWFDPWLDDDDTSLRKMVPTAPQSRHEMTIGLCVADRSEQTQDGVIHTIEAKITHVCLMVGPTWIAQSSTLEERRV